jgi:glucokinase
VTRALVGAVDVGATKTLVTVRWLPLDPWEAGGRAVRAATPTTPDGLVHLVAAALERLADEAGGRLAAVGVGTPGPLDAARGVILHAPNQGWHDVPLAALLAARLAVPVTIDDDANAGALGEATLGAGRGADPVAYVTVSTGVGSGLVVDGRIVHGAHGAAGEIGHLVADPAGPRCSCGRRGCVEAFAAGSGLERRARVAFRGRGRPDGSRGPWRAKDVFRAARDGDPDALRLRAEGEAALAVGLAALIAAVDPERIVTGGSVALSERAYVARAVRAARRRTIVPAADGPDVVPAALDDQCVLAGAAVLAVRLVEGEAQRGAGGGTHT